MSPHADAPLIFISHQHVDHRVAELLQSSLSRTFLEFPRFFNASDSASLEPGSDWFDAIVTALKECSVLLALLSPTSQDRPWVNFESGAAWINDALVIPCCIGQVRKDSLPSPYRNLQGVNLDDPADLARLFDRLARRCGLRLGEGVDFAGLAAEIGTAASTAGTDRASLAQLGDRVEERMDISIEFRPSAGDPEAWAAEYEQHARILCLADELEFVAFEYAPPFDALPFGGDNAPVVRLTDPPPWRSSQGGFRLAPPNLSRGSKFAVRLYFDPPLVAGDEAEYGIHISFPRYKLAFREGLVDALIKVDAPVRDFDYVSRSVSRACERLRYTVRLPRELGAVPLRPDVRRHGQVFPAEQAFVATEPGVFTITEEEVDGTPMSVATLDRAHPPHRAVYRMKWRPPRRG